MLPGAPLGPRAGLLRLRITLPACLLRCALRCGALRLRWRAWDAKKALGALGSLNFSPNGRVFSKNAGAKAQIRLRRIVKVKGRE